MSLSLEGQKEERKTDGFYGSDMLLVKEEGKGDDATKCYDDLEHNTVNQTPKKLGMKWFTFFTRVRPILTVIFTIIFGLASIESYKIILNVDLVGVGLFVLSLISVISYFVGALLQIVLFIKEKDENCSLLRWIRVVLIYDIANGAYGGVCQQLFQGNDIVIILIAAIIVVFFEYFIWYRLNMKYFKKRLNRSVYIHDAEEDILASQEGIKEIDMTYQKKKYCSKCGNIVDNETKKCSVCGRQYFNVKRYAKIIGCFIVIVGLLVSLGYNVIQTQRINRLAKENKQLRKEVDAEPDYVIPEDYYEYQDFWYDNKDKVEFYDDSVVFVLEGYGDYYYTYDEMMEVTQGKDFTYWAYNLENAKYLGYVPWK